MNIPYDLSQLFGYLGIFATILFGIWGIYIAIKYRKIVQISFVLRKSIALFDTIVKNIPELSVLYNGSPISQNLLLIEGALVNTGTKDILPTMIEKPICLNLPEDYKWITAKIISTHNNVDAAITLSDPTLTINSGLLKINEYIIFQALLQAPHDDNIAKIENNIHKIIKYSHRIADMPNIKNISLININIKQMVWVIIMLSLLTLFTGYLGYNIYTEKPIMQTVYSYEKPNKERVRVIIGKVNDKHFTIKGIDLPFSQTLPGEEFIKKGKEIGETPTDILFKKIILGIFVISTFVFLILLAITLLEFKRNKNIFKIFALKQ